MYSHNCYSLLFNLSNIYINVQSSLITQNTSYSELKIPYFSNNIMFYFYILKIFLWYNFLITEIHAV